MDNLKLLRVEEDGTVVFSLFLGPEFLHIGGKEMLLEEEGASIADFAGSLHGGAATLILGSIARESLGCVDAELNVQISAPRYPSRHTRSRATGSTFSWTANKQDLTDQTLDGSVGSLVPSV
jgi:hypothetical protein